MLPVPSSGTMSPAESSYDPREFRFPLYPAVARSQRASHEASRPRVMRLSQRATSNTPVLGNRSTDRYSALPDSLPAQTIRSAHTSTYYEADSSSLVLQPAALHLSFKVTWADGSLRKPDLLLGPRTDNWGQGTFTPLVSRLYRRAIRVADDDHDTPGMATPPLLNPEVIHMMEVDVR